MKFNFYNVPTSGHVNPTLPLTAELVRQGHTVIYYLNAAYREKVEATGAIYRPLPNYPAGEIPPPKGAFNPPRLAHMLLEASARLLPQLVVDLKSEPPDVVIYDSMCPWGRLAADAGALPSIASMSLLSLSPQLVLKSGLWRQLIVGLLRTFPDLVRYVRRARAVGGPLASAQLLSPRLSTGAAN